VRDLAANFGTPDVTMKTNQTGRSSGVLDSLDHPALEDS